MITFPTVAYSRLLVGHRILADPYLLQGAYEAMEDRAIALLGVSREAVAITRPESEWDTYQPMMVALLVRVEVVLP